MKYPLNVRSCAAAQMGLFLLATTFCFSSNLAQAQFSNTTVAAAACTDLSQLELPEALSISSEFNASGSYTLPSDAGAGAASSTIQNLPEFCRVRVVVAPAINIEVWLPANWNGRLLATGNGGYAGTISYAGMINALRSGYATSNTDTGHSGENALRTGDFALNEDGILEWGRIQDFAYRAINELTLKTKALINAYYQDSPEYSYWSGCSLGGSQGLVHAQRFGEDYDGILSGSSAFPWDRMIPMEIWPQVVMQQEIGAPISRGKLEMAQAAAVAACDANDGYEDGVVSRPLQCDFDPHDLVCHDGNSDSCLTAAEATALEKIYEGPRGPDGEFLWYGIEPTAQLWHPVFGLAGPNMWAVTEDHWKYWVMQDPDFDWRTLDYEKYADGFRKSVRLYSKLYANDLPDFTEFRDAGGKMLMWQGWNEQVIPPRAAVHFHEGMMDYMGGHEATDEFFRLFVAPGVGHNRGGPGPNAFGNCVTQPPNGPGSAPGLVQDADHDIFLALVRWVEEGIAPDSIIATKYIDDDNPQAGVLRTRPLCPHPRVAVYRGQGDRDSAANYQCEAMPRVDLR